MRRVSEQRLSHYPSHPAPAGVPLHVFPDHDCSYLPGRRAATRGLFVDRMPGEMYHRFMDAGFRRSGKLVYQPVCRGCRACVALRVPVGSFRASKSQRRCVRKNAGLLVTCGEPEATEEKFTLYRRYVAEWHGKGQEQEDWQTFESFLYESPVETVEYCYREPGGRLLAVGICDVCAASLSSVYFYFDPTQAVRGLGTFGALHEIATAREMGIAHYYLGFWVDGCGAMQYKASFRPCEVLHSDGVWRMAHSDDVARRCSR
jgi:arginine-tRNA-protein transferase